MDEEIPTEAPKRGRGRPNGSLNKKTLERRAAEAREAEVPVHGGGKEYSDLPRKSSKKRK